MIKNCALRKYVIATIAIIALMLSLASCGKGSLKLESFSIDYSTITTTYIVGEEVDFTGIQATAIYTDESLNKVFTYDDLTFEYDDDITATPGEKQVVISFMDPHLEIKQEIILPIKVLSDLAGGLEYPVIAIGFDRPTSLVSFIAKNNQAGKSNYGDPSFSGEFAVGGQKYVIGNENEFRLNPEFAILDNDGEIRLLNTFYADIEISMLFDSKYITLKTSDLGNNVVSYKYQGTEIVKVDTYKGLYYFSDSAVGKEIKISVIPKQEYYIYEGFKPMVLEAKVIKAYNVYEAWQLSVIDNNPEGNNHWEALKAARGISGLNVSGIVLHNDIKFTAKDVPDSFFHTTTSEVVYTNAFSGEKTVIPAGTKYLKDYSYLFHRRSTDSLTIQGNMFTLDFSKFPIVPSPGVFGPDAELHYGFAYAFCFIFKFEGTEYADDPKPANIGVASVNNLSIIGNASRNNLIDSTGNLVSGGGLMFMGINNYMQSKLDNVIENSFFVTYYLRGSAGMVSTNLKNYDSYLCFITVMDSSTLNVTNSYFNGSGGPAILAINSEGADKSPSIKVMDSICETALTGQELWFSQMGISAFMPQLFDLNNKINAAGLGSITNDKGQMNAKGILSSHGENADDVIKGIDAKGTIFFDMDGIERSSANSHWKSIYTLGTAGVATVGMSPLFITANDDKGNHTTLWYDGSTLYDLSMRPYNADPNSAIHKAFNNATSITLTMGGISIVAEFFH